MDKYRWRRVRSRATNLFWTAVVLVALVWFGRLAIEWVKPWFNVVSETVK
jgi:hypothetical protein